MCYQIARLICKCTVDEQEGVQQRIHNTECSCFFGTYSESKSNCSQNFLSKSKSSL